MDILVVIIKREILFIGKKDVRQKYIATLFKVREQIYANPSSANPRLILNVELNLPLIELLLTFSFHYHLLVHNVKFLGRLWTHTIT